MSAPIVCFQLASRTKGHDHKGHGHKGHGHKGHDHKGHGLKGHGHKGHGHKGHGHKGHDHKGTCGFLACSKGCWEMKKVIDRGLRGEYVA